jgi:predicted nucleic acid-binding protein
VYAYNTDTPQHDAAREWLEDALNQPELLAFC